MFFRLVDRTSFTERTFWQRGIYVGRTADEEGGVTMKRVVLRTGYVVCTSDDQEFNPFSIRIDGELSKALVRRVVQ